MKTVKYGVIINQDGYVVEACVILDEENKPQGYELKEYEQIMEFITNNPITDFIKAKWTGTKFVEGATQQEIDAWNLKHQPKIPDPTVQDTLNAQLLKDNASMKVEINNQKVLNSQLLLEIAKLKGGTANV